MTKNADGPVSNDNSGSWTEKEARAAAQAVIRVFAGWGVSDDEACKLLGYIRPETYSVWRSEGPPLPVREIQRRMLALLAIQAAVAIIFDSPERQNSWVRKANSAFGGRSALEVMLSGELADLYHVRDYVTAVAAG